LHADGTHLRATSALRAALRPACRCSLSASVLAKTSLASGNAGFIHRLYSYVGVTTRRICSLGGLAAAQVQHDRCSMTGTGGAAPNASGWDADELVVARTLSGDRDSETFSFLKGASLPHSNEGEHAIPSWQRSAAPGADASVRLTQLQTGAVPGSLSRTTPMHGRCVLKSVRSVSLAIG
jgi:hypothetical protein